MNLLNNKIILVTRVTGKIGKSLSYYIKIFRIYY